MSIKLLPASFDPVDLSQVSDVSNSLVPLARNAMTTAAGRISLVPSTDTFTWSSTRQGGPNFIDATTVEDSSIDATDPSQGEYVSGWTWSGPAQRTAAAQYVFYASSASWNGQLIDVYA